MNDDRMYLDWDDFGDDAHKMSALEAFEAGWKKGFQYNGEEGSASNQSELIDLRQKVAVLEVDARRYRWLRHGDNDELVLKQDESGIYLPRNKLLDAAIDAQLAAEKG